jgi:hypothetical protein
MRAEDMNSSDDEEIRPRGTSRSVFSGSASDIGSVKFGSKKSD